MVIRRITPKIIKLLRQRRQQSFYRSIGNTLTPGPYRARFAKAQCALMRGPLCHTAIIFAHLERLSGTLHFKKPRMYSVTQYNSRVKYPQLTDGWEIIQ
jgi:hypothetical protein